MEHKLICFQKNYLLRTILYDLYEINTRESGLTYTTAPNGIIGLSLVLAGQSHIYYDRKWNNLPAAHVYGLIQKPHLIQISPYFSEIAIGFKPYFLQLLLSENMSCVADTTGIDAYHLFQTSALNQLHEAVLNSKTDNDVILAVEQFVQQHLQPEKTDKRLLMATELINHNEITKVDDLANKLNISSATLRNLFRERVGLSPKELIRLTRIRNALQQPNTENLTSFAYQLGYFDQSHFIHDFKSCFGLSPKHYFKNKALVFDFYNFGRWQGDSFGINTN